MKITKKTLQNGLRVVTVPMKDNPTATVLVLVEAGSKYESKKQNGISHFLEHMCFKGTQKRPKAFDILEELDSIGSSSNAFTSHEYTGYYAKAEAKHFKKVFDIVSDIYLHSTLPEREIEKEKGVIVEEINMYRDMPHRRVGDIFTSLLYGDQPAGRNIAGEKEDVLRMKRKDFVDYKAAHYLPEATVIVVSGKVDEQEVLREVKRVFGKIPKGRKSGKVKVKEKQKKPQILLEYKKTDQTHFMLGVRTFSLFDKRDAALSLLSGVLSGGMSSRLFLKLREEMGVGYYVRSGNESFTDHGFFQISAGVDNRRIKEVLEAVLEECRKLVKYEVPKKELDKAKECLISNMKFSLESTDDIANFYGEQEILKRKIQTAEEKAGEIRKITPKDLKKAAKEIFKNESLNLALVGPFKDKGQFSKILKL